MMIPLASRSTHPEREARYRTLLDYTVFESPYDGVFSFKIDLVKYCRALVTSRIFLSLV